jgi:hypothetical protein
MKAGSGDTEVGMEMKPWPTVDGLSLEILWVLDLGRRGDIMLDGDREGKPSYCRLAMADYVDVILYLGLSKLRRANRDLQRSRQATNGWAPAARAYC